jgi:hypothetical protein
MRSVLEGAVKILTRCSISRWALPIETLERFALERWVREIGDLASSVSTVAFRHFIFAGQVTTTPDSTPWNAIPERGGGRPLARCMAPRS